MANQPAPRPMTLLEAENIVGSDGARYADRTSEQLLRVANNSKTPPEKAQAARLILAARANPNAIPPMAGDAQVPATTPPPPDYDEYDGSPANMTPPAAPPPAPRPVAPKVAQPVAAQQVTPRPGKKMMTDYDKHLKAAHLEGKSYIFTVRCVAETRLGKPREAAEVAPIAGVYSEVKLLTPIIFFRETTKYLILSNTNRNALIQLFGADPAKWIGQKVTLKAEQVKVGRKVETPVRVQLNGNQHAEQMPEPEPSTPEENEQTAAALGW